MAQSSLSEVLRVLHSVYAVKATSDLTDRQLVERYLANRDETAFAALVKRHGPMVFGVSRRLLGSTHQAEDAFQATFLVLVRRIGSIKRKQSVASWLYGVARHIAFRFRQGLFATSIAYALGGKALVSGAAFGPGLSHKALWTLVGCSGESITFVRDHLKPIARVETRRLEQLIADLDSAKFTVRQAAAKELERVGPQAERSFKRL